MKNVTEMMGWPSVRKNHGSSGRLFQYLSACWRRTHGSIGYWVANALFNDRFKIDMVRDIRDRQALASELHKMNPRYSEEEFGPVLNSLNRFRIKGVPI